MGRGRRDFRNREADVLSCFFVFVSEGAVAAISGTVRRHQCLRWPVSTKAALASGGDFPENVNYAVKSSFLLSFLESLPELASKLKEPATKDRPFEEVVQSV